MEQITIQNVRPLGLLQFQPLARGVQIIRGPNESGKSKALEAVGALLGRKADLEPDPSVLSPSFVSGFGARLTISRRKTPSGELQVDALEGLNPFLLVNPGIADADRADAARFEIICAAVGAKPDIAEFQAVLGVDPSEYMSGKTRDKLAGGLPEFTGALRNDLMERARQSESSARAHSERSNAMREQAGSDDPAADGKRPFYWSELRGALGARKANLEGAIQRRQSELEELAQLEGGLHECTLDPEKDQGAVDSAAGDVREFESRVKELEGLLNSARVSLNAHKQRLEMLKERAEQSAETHRSHSLALARIQAIRANGIDVNDMRAQLSGVDNRIGQAEAGYKASVLNEERARKIEVAEAEWASANTDQKEAQRLRTMSAACESVLSRAAGRACQKHRLIAREGRLIVAREGEEVYYHVLSGGAKTTIACDLFVDALTGAEKPAVLVIPQEAWAELDPSHQVELDEYAYQRNVLILTGAPDDGPLRVEAFRQRNDPARAPAGG